MTNGDWVWELVDLAAAQAADDVDGMDRAFEHLQKAGRQAEVEEALLQSYLFLGFPSAIEAFRRWRASGAEAPRPTPESPDSRLQRGQRTCATVYGDHYEKLRQNITRFHPDLDLWMVFEGYGKVLSRPGLGLDVRELLIVAMLVVQGESGRRQLRSHLQGALNAGAAPDAVEKTVLRAAAFAPAENLELAQQLWSAVRKER